MKLVVGNIFHFDAEYEAGRQESRAFTPRRAILANIGPSKLDVPEASGMLERRHAPETAGVRVLDDCRDVPATAVVEHCNREACDRIAVQDLAAVFL